QSGAQLKAGANNTSATVIGTWPDYATVRNSEVEEGAFFTMADNDTRARVAVLGFEIAADLFPYEEPVGRSVTKNGHHFTADGELPVKDASGLGSPNRKVIVPLATFLKRINRQSAVGRQTVQTNIVQGVSTDQLAVLEADLTLVLADLH